MKLSDAFEYFDKKDDGSISFDEVFWFDGSFIIAGENIRGYDMSEIGPHSSPEGMREILNWEWNRWW